MTKITITFDEGGGNLHLDMHSPEGCNPKKLVFLCTLAVLDTAKSMHDGSLCQCMFDMVNKAQEVILSDAGMTPDAFPPLNHN